MKEAWVNLSLTKQSRKRNGNVLQEMKETWVNLSLTKQSRERNGNVLQEMKETWVNLTSIKQRKGEYESVLSKNTFIQGKNEEKIISNGYSFNVHYVMCMWIKQRN